MGEFIFNDPSIPCLKRGLDTYALRQRVIANNVANLTTPGFRAEKVKFEELLSSQLRGGSKLPGRRTDPRHLPVGKRKIRMVDPRVVEERTSYFNGTNDVNIDREMANLARTTIAFDAAAKLLYVKYQILQKSIRGR